MSDLIKAVMAAFAATGYHMVKVDGKYQPVRISDGQPLGTTNANEEVDGTGTLPLRFEVCKKPKGSAGRGPPDGYNLQVAMQMPDEDYKIFRSDLTTILWQCKAINMTEPVTKQSRDALVHCLKKFVSKHPELEEFRERRFWCVWAAMGMILRQSASRAQRDKTRRQAGFSLPKITTRKRGRPRKQAADTSQVKSGAASEAAADTSQAESGMTNEVAPGDPATTQDVQSGDKTVDMTDLRNTGPDATESTNAPQGAVTGLTRALGDISLIDTSMLDSSAINPGGGCSIDMSRDSEDDDDDNDGGQLDLSKANAVALKPVPRSALAKSSGRISTGPAATPVPNNASNINSRTTTARTKSNPIPAPIPALGSAPAPVPGSAQDAPGVQATRTTVVAKNAPSPAPSPANVGTVSSSMDGTAGSISPFAIDQETSDSIVIWRGNEYTAEEVAQIRKYPHRVTTGNLKRVPALYKEFIYKFVDNPNYDPSSDALPPAPPARGQGGARARKAAPSPTPTSVPPAHDSMAPDTANQPPTAKSKPRPKPKAKVVDQAAVPNPVLPSLNNKDDAERPARGVRTTKGKAVAAGEHGAARTNTMANQIAGPTELSTAVEQPASGSRRTTRKKA
ncbi:hypothetical protein RhiJN_25083 [Ceratobasidium sp. AG-Ba]|nr:hypothetical protein RhiJN_25083 [Ceratobasidium sp. AG-Ba]